MITAALTVETNTLATDRVQVRVGTGTLMKCRCKLLCKERRANKRTNRESIEQSVRDSGNEVVIAERLATSCHAKRVEGDCEENMSEDGER
jgi:hypothetical protein